MSMDWTQTLTIVFTTLSGVVGVFLVSRRDMEIMDVKRREDVKTMDANHRADIKNMDDKWAKLFGLFVEKLDLNKH